MLFSKKSYIFHTAAVLASLVLLLAFYGLDSAKASSPEPGVYENGVSRPVVTALRTLTPEKLPKKPVAASAGVRSKAPSESYIVSVKSVKNSSAAMEFKDRLKAAGYNAYTSSAVVKGTRWYRVRVGFFKDRSVAKQALSKIRRAYGKEAGSAWVAKAPGKESAEHWRGLYDLPVTKASAGKGVIPIPQKNISGARPAARAVKAAAVNKRQSQAGAITSNNPRLRNQSINKAAAKRTAPSKSKPGALSDKITINFVDVNITTLVKFISDTTGRNFIFDERLRGKVTIVAPVPIGRDEAFNLFTSLLALKGFATVRSGEAYKIVPSSMVKQSSIDVLGSKEPVVHVNEGYIARVIDLKFAKSFDLLPLIKPLVSSDGYISTFGQSNSVLIIDTSLNIKKILEIVDLMDVKGDDYLPELVFLEHADVEEVIGILAEGAGGGTQRQGRGAQGGAGSAGGVKFLSDKRLNAVLIFGTPAEVIRYKELIAVLDVPSKGASSRINVYYLENADATEVANVIKGLIGETSSEGVTINAPQQGSVGGPRFGIKPTELTGKIAVTPDAATNSLIIMASMESYTALKRVIKMLDRRPKQVFVEAMIIEVRVNEAIKLGNKWRSGGTFGSDNVAVGGLGTVSSGDIAGILTGLAGFSLGVTGNVMNVPITAADGTTQVLSTQGYSFIFTMSEFEDVVEVLSTPHILTSDNKEAEIIVGENVPFLSEIERSSSTTSQPLIQSIERKDVGITLRIKPQVSEGDYVKLDLYQEISAISPKSLTGASDLITTKRSASTSIVVKDRQTVVIGGLIQNQEFDIVNKVPILGSLPMVGWLFKNKETEHTKTNLLVYLTPTIIDDFKELDEIKRIREKLYEEDGGKVPASISMNSLEVEDKVTADAIDEEF